MRGIPRGRGFPPLKSTLSSAQHCFLLGRYICSNLVKLQSYVVTKLTTGRQEDALYLDVSNDFDRGCHPLLIKELESYGYSWAVPTLVQLLSCENRQLTVWFGSAT